MHTEEERIEDLLNSPHYWSVGSLNTRGVKVPPGVRHASALKRQWLAMGNPKRVEDLARIEAWMEEQGYLVSPICGKGRWFLLHPSAPGQTQLFNERMVRNVSHTVSTSDMLTVFDAAGGKLHVFHLFMEMLEYIHNDGEVRSLRHLFEAARSQVAMAHIRGFVRWTLSGDAGTYSRLRLPGRVMHLLGRVSEHDRHVLMFGLNLSRVKDIAGLNWEAYREVKAKPRKVFRYLPEIEQWKILTGYSSPDLRLPSLDGFKVGVLKALLREIGTDIAGADAVMRELLNCSIRLVRLFASVDAIKQFIAAKGYAFDPQGVHDAGQFTVPSRHAQWTPARWAPLCLRHPEAVRHSGNFPELEKRRIFPQSLNELRDCVGMLSYPGVLAKEKPLAIMGAKLGLGEEEFKKLQKFWRLKKPKTASFVPGIHVSGETVGLPGWVVRTLPEYDIRGPVLGKMSSCCQHIDGHAWSPSIAGASSIYSSFMVVEKAGHVMAQMWVWRGRTGSVVIDSIESTHREKPALADIRTMLVHALPSLIRPAMGVHAVLIGLSGTGRAAGNIGHEMFPDEFVSNGGRKKTLDLQVSDAGYSDAYYQSCLVGSTETQRANGAVRVEHAPDTDFEDMLIQFAKQQLLGVDADDFRFYVEGGGFASTYMRLFAPDEERPSQGRRNRGPADVRHAFLSLPLPIGDAFRIRDRLFDGPGYSF